MNEDISTTPDVVIENNKLAESKALIGAVDTTEQAYSEQSKPKDVDKKKRNVAHAELQDIIVKAEAQLPKVVADAVKEGGKPVPIVKMQYTKQKDTAEALNSIITKLRNDRKEMPADSGRDYEYGQCIMNLKNALNYLRHL